MHQRAARELVAAVRKAQPDLFVHAGDRHDFACFSKYPRSHNVLTPKQEITRGLKQQAEFWGALRLAAPKMRCVSLLGNHDARLHARVLERLPELESLPPLGAFFAHPGVETIHSSTGKFIARIAGEPVVFKHAARTTTRGSTAAWFGKSTVVGHSHEAYLDFSVAGPNRTIFELNVGYLGDGRAPAFKYGDPDYRGWTLGYGVIDGDGPRFVRL
jgi:hypothetical protein